MTSYFQDGGHDVRLPLTVAYAAASADRPLTHQARLMAWLARCMRYSSGSLVHSCLFVRVSSLSFMCHFPTVISWNTISLSCTCRDGADGSICNSTCRSAADLSTLPPQKVSNNHYKAHHTQTL